MSKPKIAYAANRQIGLKCLKILLSQDWEPDILLLPTRKMAEFAEQTRDLLPHIPILYGNEFRKSQGIEKLKSLDLDYIVMVHFPYLVPPDVLNIPRIGTLNLHPAYLPFNRGWHTPSWAILEETKYGATLHWVDEGIDSGDIAWQKEIKVHYDDTADRLYKRVLQLEEQIFQEAVPMLIEGKLPRIPQEPPSTCHFKTDLEQVQKLELSQSGTLEEFVKRLKALTTNNLMEAAYVEVDGERYRIRLDIQKENLTVS